jgi:hypothetical protein
MRRGSCALSERGAGVSVFNPELGGAFSNQQSTRLEIRIRVGRIPERPCAGLPNHRHKLAHGIGRIPATRKLRGTVGEAADFPEHNRVIVWAS